MLLPITNYKSYIIDAVTNHAFTIVSSETGSGKSTQIPQYLAEHYSQVVVTEPRVMAAKTLAKRVAEEMCVELGQEVGYRTAFDSCSLPFSKIVYCTDGLGLIRTIFSEDTKTENVLIIDEVHEWNLNIETLIAWCKFMYGKWNTKVVIMSATLDTAELSDFLGEDVAVLNISGNVYDVAVEERSKYELISTIRENINDRKNILVFVAGKKEINNVIEELKEDDATVLPLYGEMEWEEQKKCFYHYSNPKVIVATNVAQTSLTIPDIDVVVDTGEARISIAENGIQGLFLKNISFSDIMQRKGRAGRTKEGKYFLCSNNPIKYRDKYSVPEIQRSILDRVVLQLAEIGLDAEKLEFYHQPDIEAILKAKKELLKLGALHDNKVTDLGHKMVKIPTSVHVARMIVEAEKYNVTEQVIKIAAIIEADGLLVNKENEYSKEGHYSNFTFESESDLLAELDVLNLISNMGYIDFKNLGIKKKSFDKIKMYIQKMEEELSGIIEIKNDGSREAIVKSCLYGLVSHVYVGGYDGFIGNDGIEAYLNRKSCVSKFSRFIVGIPKTIEYTDNYGYKRSLNFINFATRIDVNTVFELVPDDISEESSVRYSVTNDAVEITIKRKFAGTIVDTEVFYDNDHPQYNKLKAQYEEDFSCGNISSETQKVIVIDGKQFDVHYDWRGKNGVVYLDEKTLFTTQVKEVFLDSGERVKFRTATVLGREETNILSLRNAAEMKRINKIRKSKKDENESLIVSNIDDVIKNSSKIGKFKLTMSDGGYGDTPIWAYGYVFLKKNTVTFKIGDDEEIAKSSTLEALQHLFLKEIEKKYGESKFSHQNGKKKVLTKNEMEMKKDFDSLVREMMVTLSIDNITENLEFLEEYYNDLIK